MNKLEQAMEDQKIGKYKECDSVYEEILIEEPENTDVMYILSTSKMSQNKLDEGLKIINKAIELTDKAPSYYQLKGAILARQGKLDDALKATKKAVKDNPNLYQAQILVGHLYYSKGNKKDSIKHFKMAKKIDKNLPEAHVNIAKMHLEQGEVQEAINILRQVEKEHPEQASVKMMMGEAFIENGAYNFAENYFQKVLAMHPEYDLAGLFLGITKVHTGDVKSAEKLIMAFNQEHPNTREGLAALGILMFKNDRFQAAAEYLRNAIGQGLAPLSWRIAYVESLARLGIYDNAVELHKEIEQRLNIKTSTFRLGELYELLGKISKAKKQYKKIDKTDGKYVSSLLGLARCYLQEKKAEKAEAACKKTLAKNSKHAEATLLLITSLLFQDKTKKALEILECLDYTIYNNVYKKTFRLQHGLILDEQKEYKKAMEVFIDKSKTEELTIPEVVKLNEDEVKRVQKLTSKIDDERKDPVFIVGLQSVGLSKFISWLHNQGVKVLNDRLVSLGRPDILFTNQDIDVLENADDDMVRLERKLYHQKAKVFMSTVKEGQLFADSMYIKPQQMVLVKKFFPNAKVVLLKRDTADIWLNQKVFGYEPVNSKDWNEVVNQIISMDLKLIQIDMDKWLENDKDTLKLLGEMFEHDLKIENEDSKDYWRKAHFEKGHWKNYKEFLGT